MKKECQEWSWLRGYTAEWLKAWGFFFFSYSQFIPPSSSPTQSKSLFFTSLSLLMPCIWDHVTIFLNSIYICVNILYCFSFWLTSLCIIDSSFINLIIRFHCVYVQLPYPFVCRWTSRLLPCPSYCKWWCNEHWGTCVSFNSGFLGVYAQHWISGS